MARESSQARLALAAVTVMISCQCGAPSENRTLETEGGDDVTQPPGNPADIDPFTEDTAKTPPALERVPVEPPPITLSSRSHAGRLGDKAAVVARDRPSDTSLFTTLDDRGRWSSPARLPFMGPFAVEDCHGTFIVGGGTDDDIAYFVISGEGTVLRELEVDLPELPLGLPVIACAASGPAFVWLNAFTSLGIQTRQWRADLELEGDTETLAAAAAGDKIVVMRAYSDRPDAVAKLEALVVEDGSIKARTAVGDEPRTSHLNLLSRDGYLLAVWGSHVDDSIRTRVLAEDLSRMGPVHVIHRAGGRVMRVRGAESAGGKIALMWSEEVGDGVVGGDGRMRKSEGHRAALLDSFGRKLGPKTLILPRAGQYRHVAWAGEHLLGYGGGRSARVERYAPAEPPAR